MDTLLFANIFFILASIFMVLFLVALVVLAWYGLVIAKNVRKFSETLKQEGQKIASDIDRVRHLIEQSESGFKSVVGYIISFFTKSSKKSRKK